MTLPFRNDVQNPTTWAQSAFFTLPDGMGNNGLLSQFTGLTFILPMDIVSQARNEAVLERSQNELNTPTDIIGYLCSEAGIVYYVNEPVTSASIRLTNKWPFWQNAGNDGAIVRELSYFVASVNNVSASVSCLFDNLPGGNSGFNIPPWPAPPWWSQFVVEITMASAIGSGAEGRSALINDSQLSSIQQDINKIRPADWACRQINLRSGDTSWFWDPSGHQLWSDVEAASVSWDPSSTGTYEVFRPGT